MNRVCRCVNERGSGSARPTASRSSCPERSTNAGPRTSCMMCCPAALGFPTLDIVDNFSRECPAIEADTSLPGTQVVRVLERLEKTWGLPKAIVVDNGPELISKAIDERAYRNNVRLQFIVPGKPIQNAFVKSFNGRLGHEYLNKQWLTSLADHRRLEDRLQYQQTTQFPGVHNPH